MEELWWDETGALRTHGPSTYKIPGSRDVPPVFNVHILEDAPNIDAIIIPVGGGGLIAGISLAVKTINPDVQIIGVEPSRCASSTYRAFSKSGDTLFAHTRLTLFLSQKQWPPRWKPGKSSRL